MQPDYNIASNGLPNILNKKCDKTIARELAFKTIITDNVDSNRKLLKRRNCQLNNQMFAITVNQWNVSSCTSKLEHHGSVVDKKTKEKNNLRIRDCRRIDGT